MFAKKMKKPIFFTLAVLTSLLLGGALTGAAAMSVDVKNLSYSDDSGRSIGYDFSGGTLAGNAIQLPAGSVTPGNGEAGTSYLWGQASGLPPVTVTLDTANKKATLSPATAGAEGVAVLFPGGTVPAATGTTTWFHTLNLANFNIDLTTQKAYKFNIGLGRPTQGYNEASVSVVWVKGPYNGATYNENTLIVQARVANGDNLLWSSSPIVRSGLDPTATTVALDLSVSGGNHFSASVNINGQGMQSLDTNGYTLASGQFLRFPDLYPYISMGEETLGGVMETFHAFSNHEQWTSSYSALVFANDPGTPTTSLYTGVTAESVGVASGGTGYLAPGTALTYGNNQWWLNQNVPLGSTTPNVFPTYRITATKRDGTGTIVKDKQITGYVAEFAAITSPAASASVAVAPTISWSWPAGAPAVSWYGVSVMDTTTGNQIWGTYGLGSTQTSVTCGGALIQNHTYQYTIIAGVNTTVGDNSEGNTSQVRGTFTYTGPTMGGPISFDEAAVQNMIGAAMTAYNGKLIDTLMTYFSADYLNDGKNFAMQRAQFVSEFAGTNTPLPTVASSIVINGNNATAFVPGGPGTLYLIKTGDNTWLIYGNQQKYRVKAWAGYQAMAGVPNAYWVELSVDDPSDTLQAPVVVKGNGLSESGVTLNHDTANHRWVSWGVTAPYTNVGPMFGSTLPQGLPYTYTFTMTDASGAMTYDAKVNGFVTVAPSSFTPAANAQLAGAITFSWSPVGGTFTYAIELNDGSGNRIWQKYDLTGASVAYDGPALTSGNYTYNIQVRDMDDNFSMITVPFTYTGGGGQTISVSGILKDWNGNLLPSPAATVTLVGDASKTTPISLADGSFTLAGVPANTPFSLKFSKEGYLDGYTAMTSAAADFDLNTTNVSTPGANFFNLATTADLPTGLAPAAGKGLISGRVADVTYRYSSTVGGVVVTATGNGGKTYTVTYRDPFGALGGTATYGNGRYYVLNVDDGDSVTVSASKVGWSFGPRTFGTHAAGVSQGRVTGTAPAPAYVSMSGTVVNATTGAAISGARLELNGDNGKFTTAGADGTYTFDGLPKGANFYVKVTTASGYKPTFAGSVNLSGNTPGVGIGLMAGADFRTYNGGDVNTLILAKVVDQAMNPLAGATVTLTSKSQTGYTVNYFGGTGVTSATGKFVVPGVQPNDVVKVEVTLAGYAFPPVYVDTFNANSVTGKIIAGTSEDDAAVRARFASAVTAFNNNIISDEATGFASFVSQAFLNSGGNRAAFLADVQASRTAEGQKTYTVTSLTFTTAGADQLAVMKVIWNNMEAEALIFRKESGFWFLYGDQMKYRVEAWSGYQGQSQAPQPYWVGFEVRDPMRAIASVSVTGPGGTTFLGQDAANGDWKSWYMNAQGQPVDVGFHFSSGTLPPSPLTYTFTITETANPGAPLNYTATVSNFVTVTATPTGPAGGSTVTGNPTFTWSGTGIPAGYAYLVELNGPNGFYWNSGSLPLTATSFTYNGPTLVSGTYQWNIQVRDTNGNFAMVTVPSFTIQGTTPPVLKGDIDGNGSVNLADAVLALKVVSGLGVTGVRADYATSDTDVNGDGKVGMPEAVFILQTLAGLRGSTVHMEIDRTLIYQSHPPTGFTFATGQVAAATGDYVITGYSGNSAPYSAYGWLGEGVTYQDLGAMTLAMITQVPESGYTTGTDLTEGHAYAFHLANGNYGVLVVKSVAVSESLVVTMVFDYKYQGNGSRIF